MWHGFVLFWVSARTWLHCLSDFHLHILLVKDRIATTFQSRFMKMVWSTVLLMRHVSWGSYLELLECMMQGMQGMGPGGMMNGPRGDRPLPNVGKGGGFSGFNPVSPMAQRTLTLLPVWNSCPTVVSASIVRRLFAPISGMLRGVSSRMVL